MTPLKPLPVLALAITACLGTTTQPLSPLPPGGHHVLFVGNSLTYVNDLPGTVAAIAASGGDTVRVAMDAGPNLALIDHLTGGTQAAAHVAQGGWEYVVLSQGPTPSGICRDSLILWTRLFDARIRAAGATTALFMTWPTSGGGDIFDDVRISFEQAAAAVGGAFFPAGEAWRSALRADPTIPLYGPDGFHPSNVGTFLAALEIYERITRHDARALPLKAFSNAAEFALPEATIRLLHDAAHDANTRFSASPSPFTNVPTLPTTSGHC